MVIVGLTLAGVTAGLTACGSSSKVNPGSPGATAPTTSKAPSGGGAAF